MHRYLIIKNPEFNLYLTNNPFKYWTPFLKEAIMFEDEDLIREIIRDFKNQGENNPLKGIEHLIIETIIRIK